MRNPALAPLDVLIGEWSLTLTNAWFLESLATEQHGRATARWLGDAFIELEADLEGAALWHFAFGRTDANGELVALYHDPRPTSRLFRMTFVEGALTMIRQDPDFHQRFVATVTPARIDGHWDASDDGGATLRKDFDLILEKDGT
jgi:hypothetical protein